MAQTESTEVGGQTNEGFAASESAAAVAGAALAVNAEAGFNLPDGLQTVAQVFIAFETQARAQIIDIGLLGSVVAVDVFNAAFDGAEYGYIGESGCRQGGNHQGDQTFFMIWLSFCLLRK